MVYGALFHRDDSIRIWLARLKSGLVWLLEHPSTGTASSLLCFGTKYKCFQKALFFGGAASAKWWFLHWYSAENIFFLNKQAKISGLHHTLFLLCANTDAPVRREISWEERKFCESCYFAIARVRVASWWEHKWSSMRTVIDLIIQLLFNFFIWKSWLCSSELWLCWKYFRELLILLSC